MSPPQPSIFVLRASLKKWLKNEILKQWKKSECWKFVCWQPSFNESLKYKSKPCQKKPKMQANFICFDSQNIFKIIFVKQPECLLIITVIICCSIRFTFLSGKSSKYENFLLWVCKEKKKLNNGLEKAKRRQKKLRGSEENYYFSHIRIMLSMGLCSFYYVCFFCVEDSGRKTNIDTKENHLMNLAFLKAMK